MSAFNAGDFEAASRLYSPRAVRVTGLGEVLSGSECLAPTRALHARGYRLTLELSQCFATDGVALLLTRHRADSLDHGEPTLRGTAIDVASQTPDGRWRYLIDNPEAVGFCWGHVPPST
jgi:ketosteroid isomerase-like protein